MPYAEIVYIVSLVLCGIAIVEASRRARAAFVGLVLLFYAGPLLFPGLLSEIALISVRVVLGMFCYLYLKWSGFSLR